MKAHLIFFSTVLALVFLTISEPLFLVEGTPSRNGEGENGNDRQIFSDTLLTESQIDQLIIAYFEAGNQGVIDTPALETVLDNRVSEAMETDVKSRDGHQCFICKSTQHLRIDHIVALENGGTNEMNNLATLCESCLEKKRKLDETLRLKREEKYPVKSKTTEITEPISTIKKHLRTNTDRIQVLDWNIADSFTEANGTIDSSVLTIEGVIKNHTDSPVSDLFIYFVGYDVFGYIVNCSYQHIPRPMPPDETERFEITITKDPLVSIGSIQFSFNERKSNVDDFLKIDP